MKFILSVMFVLSISNALIVEEAEKLTVTSNMYYKNGQLKSETENFSGLRVTKYFDENQVYLGFKISYNKLSILEVMKYEDRKCIYGRVDFVEAFDFEKNILKITNDAEKETFYSKRFIEVLVRLRKNLETFKTDDGIEKSISELHKDMSTLLDNSEYDIYACTSNGKFLFSDERSFKLKYKDNKLLHSDIKGFPVKKVNSAYANKLILDFFHFRKFYQENTR